MAPSSTSTATTQASTRSKPKAVERTSPVTYGRQQQQKLVPLIDWSFDLMGQFMKAFGWDASTVKAGPAPKRLLDGLPTDPVERDANYSREQEAVYPLLRKLLERVEKLASLPLLRPDAYEREWRSIIEMWNEAIRENGWLQITPLCAVCGIAVQGRATWRTKHKPASNEPLISFMCSERCRKNSRERRRRLRKKLKES